MRIINLCSCTLSASLLMISGQGFAETTDHSQHHSVQTAVPAIITVPDPVQSQHEMDDAETTVPGHPTQPADHPVNFQYVDDYAVHQKQHGGQIYQRTTLESRWLRDEDGQGQFKSELETRIGTDENKLFVKIHQDKAESQQTEYDVKLLYSRMITDFWDAQAGVRYRHQPHRATDQDQYDAVFAVHGLAPYFLETDAYLYWGEDRQVSFSLETERDLLVTQKLILKPYLDVNVVISDDSRYAQKTGLSSAQAGIETRYEISKQLMPFIDVGYSYMKGQQHTPLQEATVSGESWFYGAGVRFEF